MHNVKRILLVLVTILTVGCSSHSDSTMHQYLLTDQSHPAPLIQDVHSAMPYPIIKLQSIDVADYLQDVNISIVTTHGRVYKAVTHQWAEPLNTQLENLTLQRLGRRIPQIKWLPPQVSNSTLNQLEISVSQFHSDEDGHILITGQWSLWNKDNQLVAYDNFHVRDGLKEDGYLAMTHQLAHAWVTHVVDNIARQLVSLARDQPLPSSSSIPKTR